MKLHTVQEIMASNPILETHFFRVRKNVVRKFLIFYGGLCALRNSITSDRLRNFLSVTEKFKHTSYENVLTPPSGKFSGTAPIFFSDYVGPIKPYKTVKTEV